MNELIKKDFVATGNAPLKVGAGMSKEYGTVWLEEEGYIWLCTDSNLKMDKLIRKSSHPKYDILAAGEDGEDGACAKNGVAGADGGEICLTILELLDPIKIVTRGGNGGDGGTGGSGGDGGDGRANGKGASGGDGGAGGTGGDGGNGPHLVLQYDSSEPIQIEVKNLCAAGGNGGNGGVGGRGGRHGFGLGYAPAGKCGVPGADGKPGTKGTVEIQRIP